MRRQVTPSPHLELGFLEPPFCCAVRKSLLWPMVLTLRYAIAKGSGATFSNDDGDRYYVLNHASPRPLTCAIR